MPLNKVYSLDLKFFFKLMYRSICLGRVASTGGILKHEDEGLTVFIVLFVLTFWILFEKKKRTKKTTQNTRIKQKKQEKSGAQKHRSAGLLQSLNLIETNNLMRQKVADNIKEPLLQEINMSTPTANTYHSRGGIRYNFKA